MKAEMASELERFKAVLGRMERSVEWKIRAEAGFTVRALTRDLVDAGSVDRLYRQEHCTRAVDGAAIIPMTSREAQQAWSFGFEWASDAAREGNACCRCERRGRTGVTDYNDGVPIEWQCCRCGRFVCIECTLTVPGSSPPELYSDTYCSTACRDDCRDGEERP